MMAPNSFNLLQTRKFVSGAGLVGVVVKVHSATTALMSECIIVPDCIPSVVLYLNKDNMPVYYG